MNALCNPHPTSKRLVEIFHTIYRWLLCYRPILVLIGDSYATSRKHCYTTMSHFFLSVKFMKLLLLCLICCKKNKNCEISCKYNCFCQIYRPVNQNILNVVMLHVYMHTCWAEIKEYCIVLHRIIGDLTKHMQAFFVKFKCVKLLL